MLLIEHELHNSTNNHQSFNGKTTTPQKMHPKKTSHDLVSAIKNESSAFLVTSKKQRP
jgi:hypothetical protein